MNTVDQFRQAICRYDIEASGTLVREALAEGTDPQQALAVLTEVLKDIGEGFACGELWLPDLVGAADAAQAALPHLEAAFQGSGQEVERAGTVGIGTVKGDIHDIGKSMVGALLTAHGFKVVDLGTDVPRDCFVEAIQEHKADVLALSALLTTTAAEQAKVIEAVEDARLRQGVKIMVGGGAINAEHAERIGGDGYGATAPDAVELARQLVGAW